jgi:hypothetical protein
MIFEERLGDWETRGLGEWFKRKSEDRRSIIFKSEFDA